ncbi:MAG: Maf family protein [Hyphomicrobiales bacterium]|nr:Maf family protein [Hyphomicrobiales bacterium]
MFEADGIDAPLILASASAGRADVLRNAGLHFSQAPSDIDEREIEARLAAEEGAHDETFPERLAIALAEAKALAVSRNNPDALVIGADQVMACEGDILHKPETLNAARDQLARLRNRRHSLFSGISVAVRASIAWRHCERADLNMRDFSDEFLQTYCRTEGETMLRSAGAYRVEGPGVHLFSNINGDHYTIIGLPLLPLLGYLREIGKLER